MLVTQGGGEAVFDLRVTPHPPNGGDPVGRERVFGRDIGEKRSFTTGPLARWEVL